MNNRYLVLFILMLVLQNINAQVKGRIVDEYEKPIGYANIVLLTYPDSIYVTGCVSDTSGGFSFLRMDKGEYVLKISYLGYKTKLIQVKVAETPIQVGDLMLDNQSLSLNEVTIKASRPLFQQKDGSIITTVANTLLSKEQNMVDVLTHIPGVVLTPKGSLEVFGAGKPIVYINNKKVQSDSELERLNVTEINTVELITNPGAQYDASGRAVLKVTTLKKEEGWIGIINAMGKQSDLFTHAENIRIGYTTRKINLTAYYGFTDYNNKSYNPSIKTVTTNDGIYKYDTNRSATTNQKINEYQLNFDYEISPKQIIGVQYDGNQSPYNYDSKDILETYFNTSYEDSININSNQDSKTSIDHVNIFHNGNYSKRFYTEFNFDYVSNKNNTKQYILEAGNNQLESVVLSYSNYNLYVGKLTFNHALQEKNKFIWGMEYSYIQGNSNLESNSESVDKSSNSTTENKTAGFVEYNHSWQSYFLNVGLRFENVHSTFSDLIFCENNLNRNYNNFFPAISFSYNGKKTKNTLSFSSRIRRPSFRQLSNATYYANEFMYQTGNPQLVPEKTYIAQWMLSYKYLSLRVSYNYTKDYIFPYLESKPDDPSHILSTFKNYDKIQFLKANLSIQKSFNWYKPSLSIGISKPFFTVEYLGENIKYNEINYYFTINQYFTLPKSYTLSIDYYFDNGGTIGPVEFEPYHSLNIGLKKSFFDKKLDVSLKAYDVFHTLVYKEDELINNIHLQQTEDFRSWYYLVNIRYTFNQKKTKYRGSSTTDEMNRLKF